MRLRFCSLLPRLHTSLRGLDVEMEKRLIMELDSAVRWMVESEKDRDVKEELAKFFRWVEEREKKDRSAEDEDEDLRKEQEEQQWGPVDESQTLDSSGDESKRRAFFVSESSPIDIESPILASEP